MKFSRRELMVGASVAALLPRAAKARFPHGSPASVIPTGWNTLPLGAGGLVTGLHIANDGSMVCRTDVGNIYRWSGKSTDYADGSKKWLPLLNFGSLGSSANTVVNVGGWEHVLAPGNSAVHLAIFSDMASLNKGWLWYSTNSGVTWNHTNIAFINGTTQSNDNATKLAYYKIAIDPANANVAYCGMPYNSGNSAGVYTSLNQSGGSTLATWVSVKTSGVTPIGAPTSAGVMSAGLAIDSSLGTTTIGGQTVTKHIILPVGGVGIYESTDGGVTFAEIAVTPFGTSSFWVTNGGFTAAGVYYCVVVHATAGGIWRYASGTWTNITSGTYSAGTFGQGFFLIIDPRNNPTSKAYLSVTGNNGIGAGYTSTNADTGAPVVWSGTTGGEYPYLTAASYDTPYLNYIFGQQAVNAFANSPATCIDSNGTCFWAGNQSLWYFGTSTTNAAPVAGGPNYASATTNSQFTGNTTGSSTTVVLTGRIGPVVAIGSIISGPGIPAQTTLLSQSSGVAGDNGTYVMSAAANLVGVQCGVNSLITYSWSMGRGQEATVAQDILCPAGATFPILGCQDIGAPVRGTFTNFPKNVAIKFKEYTCNSLEYAANDTSFVIGATTGQTVNVTSYVYSTNYGADGSWNTIAGGPDSLWNGGGTQVQGGQVVAVDHDHWVAVPQGNGSTAYQPAYTTNATTTATWTLCSGLPAAAWTLVSWTFANATSKPFAVGYGTDQGTVWACLFSIGSTTATLYRSTDSGATFSSILTWTISASVTSVYCLSVPTRPNELWVTGGFTGGSAAAYGLWHITNANTASASKTQITLPADSDLPIAFSLGAPSSGGGYPTLYLLGTQAGMGGTAPKYLYRGAWDGTNVTWTRFGPTGTSADLPVSCQLAGIESIRGDWNVYQRLYVASNQSGFAYYTP